MVRLVAAVAVLVMLWAQGAMAQDGAQDGAQEGAQQGAQEGAQGGVQAVETPLARAMQTNPARFEAAMLDLVAGFGGPDGLTRDGIRDHVALKRAGARASALRRLVAMDLDADGLVLRAELQVAQRAANASARGRMERQFAGADADADGRLSAGEVTADGNAAALRALGEAEEQLLVSILTLDADGNGALSADELRAAMARQGDAT